MLNDRRVMRPGTVLRLTSLRSLILESCKDRTSIIDLGGRDGAFASLLLATGPKNVGVVDLEPMGAAVTQPCPWFVQGDLTSLPLSSRVADAVLCLDVVEHIVDDRHVISEMARVLEPGGLLILTTPKHTFRLPPFSRRYVNRRWGHVRNGYSKVELEQLLESEGFVVLGVEGYHNIITRVAYAVLFLTGFARASARIASRLFALSCHLDRLPLWHGEHCVLALRQP